MQRRAIASAANKEGLPQFASGLSELGWELMSTGGTARSLRAAGLDVKEVSEVTGSPEILGGRVKTLHPTVHGGILARRDRLSDMEQIQGLGIQPIDMVICNLYPFVETASMPGAWLHDVIEEIDIGGVTLLRAAAKNWESVIVLSRPEDYEDVLEQLRSRGDVDGATRRRLALLAFEHTASYDATIAAYLGKIWADWPLGFPDELTLGFKKAMSLSSGENPHQRAAYYEPMIDSGRPPLSVRRGKSLPYGRILEAGISFDAVRELSPFGCVIAKNASLSAAAVGSSAADAVEKALRADTAPAAASAIALNRDVDLACAKILEETGVEILIAPSYTLDALATLGSKVSLSVVTADPGAFPKYDIRQAFGGLLLQERDLSSAKDEDWSVVSRRAPTDQEIRDLRLAMSVAKYARSKATALVKDGATVGICGGQASRARSVRCAIENAKDNARGSVMAVDSALSSAKAVEAAWKAGVSAIVHAGGSSKDQEIVAAIDARNMAMAVTAVDHLRD